MQAACSLLLYLAIQFALWSIIDHIPWSEGRDVFGPYRNVPGWVSIGYWGQCIGLLSIPSRFRLFSSAQILFAVMIVRLPSWGPSEWFNSHSVAVDLIWTCYVIQCLATSWWLFADRRTDNEIATL